MSAPIKFLFENETDDGDSPEIQLPISQVGPHQSVREYHYVMSGVWDGATMVLSFSVDGGTTYLPLASKTADAQGVFELGPCLVKGTISAADTLTDLHLSFNG